jgi:glycosyltransferase involved in cell wall biosynthesis
MNVVHISFTDNGGAGSAAYQLHDSLRRSGINSILLVVNKSRLDNSVIKVDPVNRNLINRICDKLCLPVFTLGKEKFDMLFHRNWINLKQRIGGKWLVFYSPRSLYDLTEHPIVNKANVIHLHWISGVIDFTTFFKKINKPIVWTMHDRGVFIGGFHLNTDLYFAKGYWKLLSEKYKRMKIRAINKASSLHFVSPSLQLKEQALAWGIRRHQFSVIKNIVNNKVFFYDKTLFQNNGVKKLLFVSQHINEYHKGLDILLDALKVVPGNFELILIGSAAPENMADNRIKCIGEVTSNDELVKYYHRADALIIPSREDNLPNVMLEALSCGLPVLATPVGGMLDVIKNNFNGLVCADLNPQSLANIISLFLEGKISFKREAIALNAYLQFGEMQVVEKYIHLYTQILNTHK